MASETYKLAQLEARVQLTSQVLGLLSDPVWSTIGGFVAIHELRKRNLIGPVADDILYAGLITINASRVPGVTELAGKGISAAGAVAAGALSAAGTVAAGAALKKGITAVASKTGAGTAGIALLPVGIGTSLAAAELKRKGYTVDRPQYGGAGQAGEVY